jgi:two-component system cell cycle sensor histidine kinase/response regulator CckA
VLSISERFKRTGATLAVAGIAAVLGYLCLTTPLPPTPRRPLRIGFEQNPPVQTRDASGFSGFAVETVNEAAKRAGIPLQWVETGTSSDEAFKRGLVDLWPLMADVEDRKKRVHITDAWLHSSHAMILRAGTTLPEPGFTGCIALYKMPLHARLLRGMYPTARLDQLSEGAAVLREVCTGGATAGFLEWRAAANALKEKPPECASVPLRAQRLSGLTLRLGVASTFAAAGAAERLRSEIGGMFRDGTMAVTMAKYSYYGLDDTWATYELMQAAERSQWIPACIAVLSLALAMVLWRALSSRQRRRAEGALRESEERFRAIFEQAAVGVAQVNLAGEIIMVNDRNCEVFGYSREELLGTRLVDKVHPDEFEQVRANFRRLMSGDTPSYNMDIRCIRKDAVIAWVRLYASLVRDQAGQPKYFIAVVEDIAERKQAEAALRESEERFRNMADTAPVMIWVTGPDKLCTFFNRRWLDFTGRTMEQEIGYGWVEGVHPDDVEACSATYSSAFDTRRNFQMEQRLRRADGEYRSLLCTGVPRFTENATFAGYVGCSIDITDLKRTQEQVLATQKLESLGVLAGGIAHDFNNLLGGIVTTSELVLEDLPPCGAAHDGVENIRVVALRAAEIVRQLMAYTGKGEAVFESVNVSQLVREMIQLLKVSISKHAILKLDLPDSLPAVRANPVQIRQVVMNLITNASEALGEGDGVIAISTAYVAADQYPLSDLPNPSAGLVRVEVTDTGCGMTPEIQAAIFDPFFTTKFAGRGLGLAAVQGIIRSHRGVIRVESEAGKGSRFEILLPSTGEPAWSSAAAPGSDAEVNGTCLVVEDEEALRLAVSHMLRKRGFSVLEAGDGKTAVAVFRTHAREIDVVLLDMTLPGMSGPEVLAALRCIRPEVRVILTTAYSQETVLAAIEGEHAWAYIQKPYQFSDLTTLLRDAHLQGQD